MTNETIAQSWPRPTGQPLKGQHMTLEPIDWNIHGKDLAQHLAGPNNRDLWTYIPHDPYDNLEALRAGIDKARQTSDWVTMAIVCNKTDHALGMLSYMRIRPQHGSVEVGCVIYGDALQRTTGATEAIYIMAKHVFETLNYRRFEWKCHNDNAASKRAALRLGFQYEGVFRNDMVLKGQNRDTAWFAMIDDDWPAVKAGFETWLNPANFDAQDQQHKSLEACR